MWLSEGSWDRVKNLDYADGPGVISRVLIRGGWRVRVRQGDVTQKQRETWEDAAPLGEDGGCALSQGQRAASGSQKRQGNGSSPRVALSTHFRLLTSTTARAQARVLGPESVAMCSRRNGKPIRLLVSHVKQTLLQ